MWLRNSLPDWRSLIYHNPGGLLQYWQFCDFPSDFREKKEAIFCWAAPYTIEHSDARSMACDHDQWQVPIDLAGRWEIGNYKPLCCGWIVVGWGDRSANYTSSFQSFSSFIAVPPWELMPGIWSSRRVPAGVHSKRYQGLCGICPIRWAEVVVVYNRTT